MYAIYGMHFSCNHGYYCIGVMTSLVACWIRDSFGFGDRIRIRSDSARVGFVSALVRLLYIRVTRYSSSARELHT